jgi:hypothetical protein
VSLWPRSLTAICSLCPLPIPSCRTFTSTSLYPNIDTSMYPLTCNRPEPRHTTRFRSESETPSSNASAHTRLLPTRPTADYLDLELDADTGTQPRHQAKPSHLLRVSPSFSICEHSSLRAWLVALGSGRALPITHPRGISTRQGMLCTVETEGEYIQFTSTQSVLVHRIRSCANITLLF